MNTANSTKPCRTTPSWLAKRRGYADAGRFLFLTVLSIFLAEIVVMFILAALPPIGLVSRSFLDGLILTVMVSPMLYLFFFRPMTTYIIGLRIAEDELKKANEDLEQRVKSRTAELQEKNEQLGEQIQERERIARALRKNRDFIMNVVEAVPYLIFIYDPERRRCVYANNRFTEALGYAPEDLYLMGEKFLGHVVHEEALPFFSESGSRPDTGEDDAVTRIECRLRHAGGSWRQFIVQKVALTRGDNGKLREILCTGIAADTRS